MFLNILNIQLLWPGTPVPKPSLRDEKTAFLTSDKTLLPSCISPNRARTRPCKQHLKLVNGVMFVNGIAIASHRTNNCLLVLFSPVRRNFKWVFFAKISRQLNYGVWKYTGPHAHMFIPLLLLCLLVMNWPKVKEIWIRV